jgi:AraC-like DNA-binding protein
VVEGTLPRDLPLAAHGLLVAAARAVALGGRAGCLAASLRVSGRTLLRRTTEAGLPPPRRLLAWVRVLLAARLLDDPRETVTGAATRCGYTSATSLRRALEAFTAVPLARLRRSGAHATAARLFLEELSATAAECPGRGEGDAARTDREGWPIGGEPAASQLHRHSQPVPLQEVGNAPTRTTAPAAPRSRAPARRVH